MKMTGPGQAATRDSMQDQREIDSMYSLLQSYLCPTHGLQVTTIDCHGHFRLFRRLLLGCKAGRSKLEPSKIRFRTSISQFNGYNWGYTGYAAPFSDTGFTWCLCSLEQAMNAERTDVKMCEII